MKVVYAIAHSSMRIGDELREAGDLVPEASLWRNVATLIARGQLFPVIVTTLPEDMQEKIALWEESIVDAESALIEGIESEEFSEGEEENEETIPVPSLKAKVEVWREFALALGYSEEDVAECTKEELIGLTTEQEKAE